MRHVLLMAGLTLTIDQPGDRNDIATVENSAVVNCGPGYDTVYVIDSNDNTRPDCENVVVR